MGQRSLRLGVHLSIEGGLDKVIQRAESLGCNCFQIFLRNPRAFKAKVFPAADKQRFKRSLRKLGIGPVVVHSVYMQNLATSKPRLWKLSRNEFLRDIIEAKDLGAKFMVIHPGSFKGSTRLRGLGQVVKALDYVLKRSPRGIKVLLENTSGSGHWLGAEIEELEYMFSELKNCQNLGLCIDTCHSWCAGYNIRTARGLDDFIKKIEKYIGKEKIEVIHLNDTQDELGSRRDRHWHIGEGKIGLGGFRNIVNHKVLREKVFILETPKKDKDDDPKNLSKIRRIFRVS